MCFFDFKKLPMLDHHYTKYGEEMMKKNLPAVHVIVSLEGESGGFIMADCIKEGQKRGERARGRERGRERETERQRPR